MRLRRRFALLYSSISCLLLIARSDGWNPEDEHRCNIRYFDSEAALTKHFGPLGVPSLHAEPIVVRRPLANADFRRRTARTSLLDFFSSSFMVTLSSSNAISEHRRTMPLHVYLEDIAQSKETTLHPLANETWYLFGETHSKEWTELLNHYVLPLCRTCTDRSSVALSFGIGNRGSGVQWHVHGPGFSEALHGRKHWVLLPPSSSSPPRYHKDQSSRQWMEYVYPDVASSVWECTLEPGDAIYFPDHWWHATINLDHYTAFISSFTTEHGRNDEL